ncbi:MAG: hypothetical protein II664_04705 [Oscillospiraceae bacterium]|nr:hypothetical protein [Oscillospiraceae bacterium]
MLKIYSKQRVTETVSSMIRTGRMAHSFLLTGESGTGRMFCAKYIAMSLLCEDVRDGVPCGECRQCRRVLKNIHPDVIIPEGTGKTGIYNVETVRERIVADSSVAPNDCTSKVYVIRDCEKLPPASQNILLKAVEEPLPYVYYIFTAHSRSVFLPTLLSRVVTLPVGRCTPEESAEALKEMGAYSDKSIADAVDAFGGNIGSCMDFLEKGKKYSLCAAVRSITDAMLRGDGYTVLRVFSGASEETSGMTRDDLKTLADLTDKVIRDALVLRICGSDAGTEGCYRDGSERLSHTLSVKSAGRMHKALLEAEDMCMGSANINVNAIACLLTAELRTG